MKNKSQIISIIFVFILGIAIGYILPKSEKKEDRLKSAKQEFEVLFKMVDNYTSATNELIELYNAYRQNDSVSFESKYYEIITQSYETKILIAGKIKEFENDYTHHSKYMQKLKLTFLKQTLAVDNHIKSIGNEEL